MKQVERMAVVGRRVARHGDRDRCGGAREVVLFEMEGYDPCARRRDLRAGSVALGAGFIGAARLEDGSHEALRTE